MGLVVSAWLSGVFSDLNILEVSSHIFNVLSGQFPTVYPSYTISGKVSRLFYYYTDRTSPDWNDSVQTLCERCPLKENIFCSLQDGIRKCVERLLGVLFHQFKYIFTIQSFGL